MNFFNRIKLYAAEKVTIAYILVTFVVLLVMQLFSFPVWPLMLLRVYILAAIFILSLISSFYDLKIVAFLRFAFIGALLSYWYPETYEINRFLPNCDHLLALWEQTIFGCQPAVLFAKAFPQIWLSEYFNLGYFSYYFMIVGSSLIFFLRNRRYFEKYFFKVMFTFFVFYLIFILFPTSGPQYYFSVIGENNVSHAVFPAINDYFKQHTVTLPTGTMPGFFKGLVEATQQVGERPTAAFPSSHVGISTFIMIVIFRKKEYGLGMAVLPLYVALVMATVYIQAHFLIDAIVGFVFAFALDPLSSWAYHYFKPAKSKLPTAGS